LGNTRKCSFILCLGSAALISLTNEVRLFKKLNSAYGTSLHLNLANRTISWRRGAFGFYGVEETSQVTLHSGSFSSAYIKLGAASVWDCSNVNFPYKVPCNCVQVLWIQRLMCYNLMVSVNQQWTSANKINKTPKN